MNTEFPHPGAILLIRLVCHGIELQAAGDHGRTVAMRDTLRERIAICTIDGETSTAGPARVTLSGLTGLPADQQGGRHWKKRLFNT